LAEQDREAKAKAEAEAKRNADEAEQQRLERERHLLTAEKAKMEAKRLEANQRAHAEAKARQEERERQKAEAKQFADGEERRTKLKAWHTKKILNIVWTLFSVACWSVGVFIVAMLIVELKKEIAGGTLGTTNVGTLSLLAVLALILCGGGFFLWPWRR